MPQSKKPVQRKSKDEVAAALKHKAFIDKQRAVARSVFPLIEKLPTLYDAQTAFNAAAGYIKWEMQAKEKALTVADLPIDLSKEPKGVMKDAVMAILEAVKGENAGETFTTLETMGSKLPQHVAARGMKEKASSVKMDDFIA